MYIYIIYNIYTYIYRQNIVVGVSQEAFIVDLHFLNILDHILINSSPPSAAYMRQLIGSALVQVMACRLFGDKPLPEPMLEYCQLDPNEQTSVKF